MREDLGFGHKFGMPEAGMDRELVLYFGGLGVILMQLILKKILKDRFKFRYQIIVFILLTIVILVYTSTME